MAKVRLDALLIERELTENIELAQRLIRAGKVRVGGHPQTKPGHTFADDVEISVAQPNRFVSRGGEKLQAALDGFPIDLQGRICLDIGSSTGGFTDAMLQAGATRVYAIDVGTGQLDWKLRNDSRVVVMEQCNARHLTPEDLPEKGQFASVDVSFISLTKILPPLIELLEPLEGLVTLIKPQFEARREQVGKKGVVRDPLVHEEVIQRIRDFGETSCGLQCVKIINSPLKGPAGNIEFLAYWTKA